MGKIKSIAVAPNRKKLEAEKMAKIIRGWLSLKPEGYKVHSTLSRNVLKKTDVVIGLGGDGWLLRIAREIFQKDKEIPIVAINFGTKGYLCEIQPDEAKEKIERILQGDFAIEERTRIQAEIRKIENDELVGTIDALNEIVIGGIHKTVSLNLEIQNGRETRKDPIFIGNGFIISTKTGSTAYSYNAGGKVIDTDDFVITALIPMLDNASNSWLTREKSVIFSTETIFEIHNLSTEKDNSPFVIGDGQTSRRLKIGEYAIVKKSPGKTLFVKF